MSNIQPTGLENVVLNGYRIMWMVVMFDLPVYTPKLQKAANRFRNFLLDEGFQMAQYSVYMRCCASKEKVEARIKRLRNNLPEYGNVNILAITDRQYENIVSFSGRTANRKNKTPGQLALF